MVHRVGLLQACVCLLVSTAVLAAAQDVNLQGTILYNMGKWLSSNDAALLSSLGWVDGSNPCTGSWQGVTCNAEGYVTSLNLANKGLKGSLPAETSLWGGLTALTSLDLSGNQLGGAVPAQITAAGTQLTSINLSGNTAICGTPPAGMTGIDTTGTSVGVDCSAVVPTSPAASPAVSPVPVVVPPTEPEAPAANDTATPPAVEVPAPTPAAPSPSPPPTQIANAPICGCALKGFGSTDCSNALKNVCTGARAPAFCEGGDPSSDENAAEQLGQYLSDTCFTGQGRETSICSCVQNLLGNDCAKARVGLCRAKDPMCLAFQNIIDVNGSSSAAAVGQVAPFLNEKCPISEPTVPGVKATMEFPNLSMGQYITSQYTQNVANALSSVTMVPSTDISTLDVRPFTGSGSGRRRSLLQASGNNGVQATYFLATSDPAGVSSKLSTAAEDGSLSTMLSQYGIYAQAGGLKVQSFLPAPSPAAAPSASGFPMWAIAPIVIGIVLLLGALLCCFCMVRRKNKRDQKAREYAADAKATPAPIDTLPKTYDYTPSGPDTYPTVAAPAAAVGAAAAYTATKPTTPAMDYVPAAATPVSADRDLPRDLPVSRSIKVTAPESSAGGSSPVHTIVTSTNWDGSSTSGSARGVPTAGHATLTPVKTAVPADVAAVPAAAAAPAAAYAPRESAISSAAAAGAAAGVGVGAATGAAAAASTAGSSWRSNVRPASGQLPNTGGATSSMAGGAGKGTQQAERAKFWAQFQETWQQVRQNQNIHGDEPGTPSSGTNWTDVTGQVSPKKSQF